MPNHPTTTVTTNTNTTARRSSRSIIISGGQQQKQQQQQKNLLLLKNNTLMLVFLAFVCGIGIGMMSKQATVITTNIAYDVGNSNSNNGNINIDVPMIRATTTTTSSSSSIHNPQQKQEEGTEITTSGGGGGTRGGGGSPSSSSSSGSGSGGGDGGKASYPSTTSDTTTNKNTTAADDAVSKKDIISSKVVVEDILEKTEKKMAKGEGEGEGIMMMIDAAATNTTTTTTHSNNNNKKESFNKTKVATNHHQDVVVVEKVVQVETVKEEQEGDLKTFVEVLHEEYPKFFASNNNNKPYVFMCSKTLKEERESSYLHMIFGTNGFTEILYDKLPLSNTNNNKTYYSNVKLKDTTIINNAIPHQEDGKDKDVDDHDDDEVPAFVFGVHSLHKDCTEHPWFQEYVIKRRLESPKLDYGHQQRQIAVENQWMNGIHYPNQATSGLRLLKDRPMIIQSLGEVFWRNFYPKSEDVDLSIFRSKVSPRPGSLTYHDVQGVSHSFRKLKPIENEDCDYVTDKGKEIWMSSDINDNPYRYDEQTNNKGFCSLLTGTIMKPLYDMDALVRNSFFHLLSEYKQCERPHDIPPGDLNAYKGYSGYKFSITMENTQLEGYVSEKVFLGKLAGNVPIYFGAPDANEYINPNSYVSCNPELDPSFIAKFRQFLVKPPRNYRDQYFTMFNNNTKYVDMNHTTLLNWSVEYLRPHLKPCVDKIIELDHDTEKYNAIRNEPLIQNPKLLHGYANYGLGMAYKYLRTGRLPTTVPVSVL